MKIHTNNWLTRSMIGVLIISLFALVSSGCSPSSTASGGSYTVQIAINGGSGPLYLAKTKGWFEEEFKKIGAKVEWSEFPSGPPLIEALVAGRVDFASLGDGAMIAAQAAGIPITVIAQVNDGLKGSNQLIVPSNSSIQSLADLKGKKIVTTKGTTMHVFLLKALDTVGLTEKDVEFIHLQLDEAKAAFESGGVDAWVTMDPHASIQKLQNGATILASAESLNIPAPSVAIAHNNILKEHPETAKVFLNIYNKALQYEKEHSDEAVALYAAKKKVKPEIMKLLVDNSRSDLRPVTPETIEVQQQSADFMYETGFIKRKIQFADVVNNTFIEQIKTK